MKVSDTDITYRQDKFSSPKKRKVRKKETKKRKPFIKKKATGYCYTCGKKNVVPSWIYCNGCQ